MDELERLAAGKYLRLTTFRKSGVAVPTPVWVARDGDHLYVTTQADSGKAKRLRNNSQVTLAPCDMRGNPTGPEVAGTAVLLDQAGTAKVGGLMAKRYGLMYHALTLRQKFSRGAGSVGIEISVGQQDSPPAPSTAATE